MATSKTGFGLVYSTDPNFKPGGNAAKEEDTLDKKQQKLRLRLEKRNGKPTTIVAGFIGKEDDLEALGKLLKSKAGSGGSVKDGIIIIQGDVREKAVTWLKEMGFSQTK